MDKTAEIDGDFGGKTHISTILKLFESYLVDNSIDKAEGVFEDCRKCDHVHPVIVQCIRNEVGLNRINSDHSVIKSYWGVVSRYINRHASMFAYVRKLKGMSRLSALPGSMASLLPMRNSVTTGYSLRMI